jgi:hypothetical protein
MVAVFLVAQGLTTSLNALPNQLDSRIQIEILIFGNQA